MRDYFHTDDSKLIAYLANVFSTAVETETAIRIHIDNDGEQLKVKRGQGCWSPAFYGTYDFTRDEPVKELKDPNWCETCEKACLTSRDHWVECDHYFPPSAEPVEQWEYTYPLYSGCRYH